MDKLFRKIDWSLTVARIIITISHIFLALAIIAYGVFSIIRGEIMLGMCVLSVGIFVVCISVVLWMVVSSYFKDIKLIRNRLYGVSANDIASQYKLQVTDPPVSSAPTVIVDTVGVVSSAYSGYGDVNPNYYGGYGNVNPAYNNGYINYNGVYADANPNNNGGYGNVNPNYIGGYDNANANSNGNYNNGYSNYNNQ